MTSAASNLSATLARVRFGKSEENAPYTLLKCRDRWGQISYMVEDSRLEDVYGLGMPRIIRQEKTEKQATRGLCKTWHSNMLSSDTLRMSRILDGR